MSLTTRALDALTLRRVVALLLIGGFASPIFGLLDWLATTAWELARTPALRAFLLSGLGLALEAGAIYLAARGLLALLRSRVGGRATGPRGRSKAKASEPRWHREGGSNGDGPGF